MKATKLLLILLSCMLVVGCKKNNTEDEPTPPTPQTDTISAEQLKSYFPYKNMDKIVFRSTYAAGGDVTYTVISSKLSYEKNNMQLITTMSGTDYDKTNYFISLKGVVTDGTLLQIDFQQITANAFEIKGNYTYDATKEKELPETITLSNGAIIKKNTGLYYYKDTDLLEWTFYRRQ